MKTSHGVSIFLVIGALLLPFEGAACVPTSSHQGSDLSKLDEFRIEKNRTTEQELVEHFGPSERTITRGDGQKILNWTDIRAEGTNNAAGWLPLVGHFTNRTDQTVNRKTLSATVQSGIVVDYTVSDGNSKIIY